jgi:hypothetical protein
MYKKVFMTTIYNYLDIVRKVIVLRVGEIK